MPADAINETWDLDHPQVRAAISKTLPDAAGQHNNAVFNLARQLKALSFLADAAAERLRPIVESWHELALPAIRTRAWEETWIDFLRAWKNVKFAAGAGPLEAVLARARETAPPVEAKRYDQPQVRLLASICRELQREAGDSPFFLSCRKAAHLLSMTDHKAVARWLGILFVNDGLLEVAQPGTRHRAARYYYLGSLTLSDTPATQLGATD